METLQGVSAELWAAAFWPVPVWNIKTSRGQESASRMYGTCVQCSTPAVDHKQGGTRLSEHCDWPAVSLKSCCQKPSPPPCLPQTRGHQKSWEGRHLGNAEAKWSLLWKRQGRNKPYFSVFLSENLDADPHQACLAHPRGQNDNLPVSRGRRSLRLEAASTRDWHCLQREPG